MNPLGRPIRKWTPERQEIARRLYPTQTPRHEICDLVNAAPGFGEVSIDTLRRFASNNGIRSGFNGHETRGTFTDMRLLGAPAVLPTRPRSALETAGWQVYREALAAAQRAGDKP